MWDPENRVMLAIEFTEAHLCEAITTNDIIAASGISTRHFYRAFQRLTGDTIKHYLCSRRLTEASKELVSNNANILHTAIKYQFHSHEVFSRAFKRVLWISPRKFREIDSPFSVKHQHPIDGTAFSLMADKSKREPYIMPPMRKRYIVGIRVSQPHYGLDLTQTSDQQQMLHRKLKNSLSNIEHLLDDKELIITTRNRESALLHTVNNIHGFEVSKPGRFPADLTMYELMPAHYAVFQHNDYNNLVDVTVSYAFRWLDQQGFYLGDAPSIFKMHGDNLQGGELYLPISKSPIPTFSYWRDYIPVYELKKSA